MEILTLRPAILAVLAAISAPSAAQIVVRGPLAYDHPVRPRSVVSQEFDLENTGDEVVVVSLYLTDYSYAADGTNDYGAPGTLARSNANWVRFSPSSATLEPGQVETIRYAVAVPDDAHGSYWSMLMIEGQPGDLASAASRNSNMGLRQIIRYGVQIATHAGDDATAMIEFENGSLVPGQHGPALQIDLLNTGDLMLRPGLSLRLVGPDGGEMGPFTADPKRLYPGTSIRALIPLTDVPPGQYSALLVADAGDDRVFGLQLELTL